jgi:hypothetical protein
MPIISSFGSGAVRAYGLIKAINRSQVSLTVDYLVIGGGGGGGGGNYSTASGGGGAGGFLTGSGFPVTSGQPYTVTVGAGGVGGVSPPLTPAPGSTTGANGSNSSFTTPKTMVACNILS